MQTTSQRLMMLLVLLASVLLATSCVGVTGNRNLSEMQPPAVGEPLLESYWNLIEGKNVPYAQKDVTWVLPNFIFIKDWRLNKDLKTARYSRLRWIDPGVLFAVILPVHVTMDYRFYPEEGPSGQNKVTWTPFWAGGKKVNWPEDRARIEASGIPLFYGSVRAIEPNRKSKLTVQNVLWTLGPFLVRAHGTPDDGEGGEVPPGLRSSISGYWFNPIFAGGIPGVLAWTSWDFKTTSGDRFYGHGPLVGALGVLHARQSYARALAGTEHEPPAKWRAQNTLVVLGTLWMSRQYRDLEGDVVESTHGPLWGMFGWGRKDGAPKIKFLWIPIKLGKGKAPVTLPEPVPPEAPLEEEVVPAAE